MEGSSVAKLAEKATEKIEKVYYRCYGKVMFRQTFIRGCQKRGLNGGATNDSADKKKVMFTLQGNPSKIKEIIDFLSAGKPLNSWGAKVNKIEKLEKGHKDAVEMDKHQVNTSNVDEHKWKEGVEMYL